MSEVYTSLGRGRVVESSSSRGVTLLKVVGEGFESWFKSADVSPIDDNVNEENTTVLPYNPTPQVTDTEGSSTLQPTYEIDSDERTSPIESLDVQSVLGKKYVKLKAQRPGKDTVAGRLLSDPERFCVEKRSEQRLASVNQKYVDAFYLMDNDPLVREAAWKDVRRKAVRLRNSGNVTPQEVTPRAIYARVVGDHGTYDTIVVRGGATIGAGGITEWSCDCEWGKHAFLRKHTYIGRLCSHAYAAYMELQSQTRLDINKDIKKRPRKKRGPNFAPALTPLASLNVGEENFYPHTHETVHTDVDDGDYTSYVDEVGGVQRSAGRDEYEYEGFTLSPSEGWEEAELFAPNGDSLGVLYPDYDDTFNDESDLERALSTFVNGLSETEWNYYTSSTLLVDQLVHEPFSGSGPRDLPEPESSAERSKGEDEFEDVTGDDNVLEGHLGSVPEIKFHPDLYKRSVHFAQSLFNAWCSERGYNPHVKTSQTVIPFQEEVGYLSDVQYGQIVHGSVVPAPHEANVKTAGRHYTFQEQMDLINEPGDGDDEIYASLNLKGTHYVR